MRAFFTNFFIGFFWILFILFVGIPAIALTDSAQEPITFQSIQKLYRGNNDKSDDACRGFNWIAEN